MRVTFDLTDDEMDVLDALRYVEGVKQRGAMAHRIVSERLATATKVDGPITELVAIRRRRRATARGQLELAVGR